VNWLRAVQKLFRSSRRVPVTKNGIKAPNFTISSLVLTPCYTRIVDDLLTLSKLDSNLLQINQSPVRATSILDDMQRIFEIEAGRADIELRLEADPSIKAMNIDNAMLDTGRVHQILINLITNALKL
jgi:signal transduction histidine kinase